MSNLETESWLLQAHPWHGVDHTVRDSDAIRVFIETVQFDTLKYELDRPTGLLRVDQPQQMSTLPPYAYGFVPRTLCGANVAAACRAEDADGAPLDVFVLSERPIAARGIIAEVRIVAGIPVHENGRADDKLIGVLRRDGILGAATDVDDLPVVTLDRVTHFLRADALSDAVDVGDPYGRERAQALFDAACEDYREKYG